MLRGDIDPDSTQLSFDTVLASFYAMYQASPFSPHYDGVDRLTFVCSSCCLRIGPPCWVMRYVSDCSGHLRNKFTKLSWRGPGQITAGRDYKQTIFLCFLVIGWAILSNFILIQLLVAVINEVSHRKIFQDEGDANLRHLTYPFHPGFRPV